MTPDDDDGPLPGEPPTGDDDRRRFAVERARRVAALNQSLDETERLSGMLAICAWCHQVGADDHARRVEAYAASDSAFAEGTCAACAARCTIELPDHPDD
jgi:hypothetical protein